VIGDVAVKIEHQDVIDYSPAAFGSLLCCAAVVHVPGSGAFGGQAFL